MVRLVAGLVTGAAWAVEAAGTEIPEQAERVRTAAAEIAAANAEK